MSEEEVVKFPNANLDRVESLKRLALSKLEQVGANLQASGVDLVEFVAREAEELAAAAGTPDIDEVISYSRSSIALFAGIEAIEQADEADRAAVSILTSTLSMIARALAGKALGQV